MPTMEKIFAELANVPFSVTIPTEPLLAPHSLTFYHRSSDDYHYWNQGFCHNKYVMCYVFSGERTVRINDSLLHLQKGEAIILPPFLRHESCGPKRDFRAIQVSFSLPPEDKRVLAISSMPLKITKTLEADFSKVAAAFLERSTGDVAAGEESACLFAFFLHRLLKKNGETKRMPAVNDGTYSLLSRTMEYILLHLDHRVTLRELEQALHVSGSTIRQKFRKYMDCSIGNYQRRRRLVLACDMLRDSNLSIAEIAAKVGFATPEGMRRALQTEAGCSAKSIRNSGEPLQNFTIPFKDKLR